MKNCVKVKTSELIGAALDWAVAQLDDPTGRNGRCIRDRPMSHPYWYSTEGNLAIPIIEREKIELQPFGNDSWRAQHYWSEGYKAFVHVPMVSVMAPTPLIAAMRCYVASKLGDEVDIPKELL